MGKVYVAMGGWDLSPFDGRFYPDPKPKSFRKLAFYSHFLDAVEVNATFYNTHFSPAQIRRWIADVSGNENFIFTIKLFHGFTHTFDATESDVRSVRALLDILSLADKLGGLLVQFPYSFTSGAEQKKYVRHLAKTFGDYRVFLEVRHDSWKDHEFFRDSGLRLVNVDLPKILNHIPFASHAWGGAAYFRMMGRNSAAWRSPWRKDGMHMVSDRYHYIYTDTELEEVAATISNLSPDTTFVVFHNDPEANSLYNGFRLRRILHPDARIRVPRRMAQNFPLLKEFAEPV